MGNTCKGLSGGGRSFVVDPLWVNKGKKGKNRPINDPEPKTIFAKRKNN